MKNNLALIGGLLLVCLFTFSFCNNSEASGSNAIISENDTLQNVDTSLDKYVGLYKFFNNYFSVGKFPSNTRVHTATGDRYLPLDKQFHEKYFLVEDNKVINRPFFCRTDQATPIANGYLAAPVGNLILSVSEGGVIQIQNYNNYGTKDGDTLTFNLGGTGEYGKFVPRGDGKYNLSVKNAIYEWTQY